MIIAPDGNVSSASFGDSIKLDSSTAGWLTSAFDMQICDSIENQKLYTKVTLLIDRKNSDNQIKVERIRNIEMRSRESIMQMAWDRLKPIQAAYDTTKGTGWGIDGGKMNVNFSINENGDVIHSSYSSNLNGNNQFESIILDIIESWKFGMVYNPGYVTKVICPIFITDLGSSNKD
jgi:hypothetical protein